MSVWRGAGLSVVVGWRDEQTGPVSGRTMQPQPRSLSGAPRHVIWQWLEQRYRELLPDAELCVADTDHETFSRGGARNAAARLATRPVLLIADADTVFTVEQLLAGIHLLGWAVDGITDAAEWCVPYRRYVQLTARDTHVVLGAPPAADVAVPRRVQHDVASGTAGLLLVGREAFEHVGGYDERFAGWGYEDTALTMALETMLHGCPRVDGVAVHLCHPRSPLRRRELSANRPLFERYLAAHYDAPTMRRLIEERQ